MMTLRQWIILAAAWVLLVGGGWMVAHWVDVGTFLEPPNYTPEVLDTADVYGDGDCERYYRDKPERDQLVPNQQYTWLQNCQSIHWAENRRWRIALVQFLAIVFGPPLLLGALSWLWAILRPRTSAT